MLSEKDKLDEMMEKANHLQSPAALIGGNEKDDYEDRVKRYKMTKEAIKVFNEENLN